MGACKKMCGMCKFWEGESSKGTRVQTRLPLYACRFRDDRARDTNLASVASPSNMLSFPYGYGRREDVGMGYEGWVTLTCMSPFPHFFHVHRPKMSSLFVRCNIEKRWLASLVMHAEWLPNTNATSTVARKEERWH